MNGYVLFKTLYGKNIWLVRYDASASDVIVGVIEEKWTNRRCTCGDIRNGLFRCLSTGRDQMSYVNVGIDERNHERERRGKRKKECCRVIQRSEYSVKMLRLSREPFSTIIEGYLTNAALY